VAAGEEPLKRIEPPGRQGRQEKQNKKATATAEAQRRRGTQRKTKAKPHQKF
jgi:hypothetical protein